MSADYDLVILGGTVEGRTAAMLAAATYGARVALIEPPGLFEHRQRQRYLLQGLQQVGKGLQRQAVGRRFGFGPTNHQPIHHQIDWTALVNWSAIAAQTQTAIHSPAVMSANGVDVVRETPERLSRQSTMGRLLVTTAQRQLRSRAVLAAFGTVPTSAQSDGFETLLAARKLPEQVNVIGGSPAAVLWAEAFAQLGSGVTVVSDKLLASEDGDIRRLVRSQLITSGVKIIQKRNLTPAIAEKYSLVIDDRQPAFTLPSFVHRSASPLTVNRRLQTLHPRVFACGSLLGGSTHTALACYEAKIAVWNALFVVNQRVDYGAIALDHGGAARAGLTEAQAKQRYGDATQIWTASSANSADLSRQMPLPRYCKLVSVGDRLVGIHLFGDGAGELIYLLAKAIGKPVATLSRFADGGPVVAETWMELVELAVGRSQQTRWQVGQWRRDWAENWFNWRRSR
ncbi:MAG: FAD-dependent oxidoreductase [Phormidesmis sp.]